MTDVKAIVDKFESVGIPDIPANAVPAGRSMVFEVDFDTTPQQLRTVRPFHVAVLHIPPNLKPEAQIVLQSLLSCFERHGDVKEGLIGDLLWGFEQCGIPAKCSAVGLMQLERDGYVRFQAPDGAFVGLDSDLAEKAWVRYQKPVLDMVYERTTA